MKTIIFSTTSLLLFLFTFPSTVAAQNKILSKKQRKPDKKCLAELRRLGVNFKSGPWYSTIKTPVTILDGKIRNIQYMNGKKKARPIMDCRTAVALHRVAPIFSVNGEIDTVIVGKFYSYRYVKNSSVLSHHSTGLAVDIYGIKTKDGKTYNVSYDYQRKLGKGPTCEGHAKNRGARLLRQLACDLAGTHYFSSILTPDSDREHLDHFHLSVFTPADKKEYPNRTALLEPQYFGRKWVKSNSRYAKPSIKKVWKVVGLRRRSNSRLKKK
ncbi:extensin family protein [Myxococcota bacterium]|nr:extensin family protein [Myxococcota bacterium]MBU1496215.1 extensin family protein [Myxococcota bacterium]